jgi:hypothetical protein
MVGGTLKTCNDAKLATESTLFFFYLLCKRLCSCFPAKSVFDSKPAQAGLKDCNMYIPLNIKVFFLGKKKKSHFNKISYEKHMVTMKMLCIKVGKL